MMNNGRVSWWAVINVASAVLVAGVIGWAVLAQQRVKKLEDRIVSLESKLKAEVVKKAPAQQAAVPTKRKRRPATLASTRPAATQPTATKLPN